MQILTRQINAYPATPQTLMARIVDDAGNALLQAGVEGIEVDVFDLTTPATPTQTGDYEPTVAATIFDTLQTADDTWTVDQEGYNFRHVLAGAAIPDEKTRYVAQITLTLTGGALVKTHFPILTLGWAE